MDSMCASIVVPVYNSKNTIRVCIESLLSQVGLDGRYEVIVVDNNSSDGTDEIVRKFPVLLLYERDIQTSYAARNKGIQAASGDIIAFTDADCIAAPNWLRELLIPFNDPTVGGVGGQVRDDVPQNDVEAFLCSLQLFTHYQRDDSFLPVILTNNAAYRRENLLALDCFNSRLYTGSDIDLAWRMQLEIGAKVEYAPEAIVYHVHRSSLVGMARQFRRHGFGEILLDAMYHDSPGYRRTLTSQLMRMGRQSLALLVYLRSLLYRQLKARISEKDRMYNRIPLFWLVAEGSNLQGKLIALWATRFLTLNPVSRTWEDPGER